MVNTCSSALNFFISDAIRGGATEVSLAEEDGEGFRDGREGELLVLPQDLIVAIHFLQVGFYSRFCFCGGNV